MGSFKHSWALFISFLPLSRHVGVLYIKGTDFRINPIPLKTVRPFVMDTISLSKTKLDPMDQDAVSNYLIEKVLFTSCH